MSLEQIKELLQEISLVSTDEAMRQGLIGEYRPRPPITRNHLIEIEQFLGASLPDEYVDFVTGIAEGGAFGLCDLNPLREAITAFVPGPFIVPPDSFVEESNGYELSEEDSNGGCIGLADFGCGSFAVLPILGSQRGVVWEYYGADDGLWHTYGETFQQWFVRQLRDGLARYNERVKRAADEKLKRCSPSSGKNKSSLWWKFW